MKGLLSFGLLVAISLAADAADKAATPTPSGYKLLYEQNFEQLDAIKDFVFSDPKAWRITKDGDNHSLELFQQSKYEPANRSPFNIALIADKVFGDFVLEADLLSTKEPYGHQDMCLFFGFTAPQQFYYNHIAVAPDPHAHNLFIVTNAPRLAFAKEVSKGVTWGKDQWHKVRIERKAGDGSIKVFYDDLTKPIMLGEDKTFPKGGIGFGSFDDIGKMDNIRIWGPSVETKKTEFFKSAALSKPKQTEIVDLGGGVKMEFVLIPAGSFMMGSDAGTSHEKPVHKVTITKPFYLGKFEVTQQQWRSVMGNNPSYFKGPKLPVEQVSWNDCQSFLNKLQEKTGRKFALPTEAQWEYACRAGTTTDFNFGDSETSLAEHCWFRANSEGTTHPVGEKKPNPWGLYDLHGNVSEWCVDWCANFYPNGDATDPLGPSSGIHRVLRGGGCYSFPERMRSFSRDLNAPEAGHTDCGLRCVMGEASP